MADTEPPLPTDETDGAKRWYEAILKLDRLDELERRIEALEAWKREQTSADNANREPAP